MVATDSARARAYASAVLRAGLGPLRGIFYGAPAAPLQPVRHQGGTIGDLWLPDITPPLRDIFQAAGWPVIDTGADAVNADACVAAIQQAAPDLVVFAGRGGEIVSRRVLDIGAPFLHVHSGALPELRGSTTLYYSIIERRCCTVSALLLAPDIDTGPVVGRADYPLPPADIDTDLLYDSAIRADLLVKSLRDYRTRGRFVPMPQPAAKGRTYYVIHPVLKHLAILSLGDAGGSAKNNKR